MVSIEDIDSCDFCKECSRVPKLLFDREDLISCKPSTKEFILTIESSGVMPASQILQESLAVLQKKLTMLEEDVAKLAS